MDPLSLKAR